MELKFPILLCKFSLNTQTFGRLKAKLTGMVLLDFRITLLAIPKVVLFKYVTLLEHVTFK